MKLTWCGHSAFGVEVASARILIDPFLSGNPSWDGDWTEAMASPTHILLTHGHNDHVGDAFDIAKETGAQIVGSYEVCMWLAGRLGTAANVNPGNHGGTVDCGGFTVSMVRADHSSAYEDDTGFVYLGNPLGLIIKADGEPALYHMGDTDIFGDMALINELYAPDIAIVPIGDRFTMGAKTAAMACQRYFDFKAIVPCHYGTFPILDQTADKFIAELGAHGGKVRVPDIGSTIEL